MVTRLLAECVSINGRVPCLEFAVTGSFPDTAEALPVALKSSCVRGGASA